MMLHDAASVPREPGTLTTERSGPDLISANDRKY
jgi:hypothetical protein